MTTNTLSDTADIARLQQRGMIIGVAGLVVGAIGALLQPDQLLPSWLIGFTFCLGLSMGCLTLLMMQHLSGGQWGLVARRVFEAGSRLLPYCVLLFIPIAIFLPKLYLWARPEAVHADEILAQQGAVHERVVLHHPRGGLFPHLAVLRDVSEPLVGCAGSR